MGNYILILIAGVMLAGLFYTANRSATMVESSASVSNTQYDVLARNAAITGFELAKQALSDNFVDQEIEGNRLGADFHVTAVVNGFEADVVSTGRILNADGETATYVVSAQIERKVPAAFEFALSAMNNIVLNGNISVYSLHPRRNANVHTNGNLRLNGSTSLIQGFGTYSGSLNATADQVDAVFQPNYNPESDPLVAYHPPIPLPTIDVATIAAGLTPDRTNVGPTIIAPGTYDFGGTRQNPHIWYVDGSLSVTGDASFKGYNIFLVTGQIDLDGNIDAPGATNGENTVAFYTDLGVDVGGGKDLEAQIFANREVWFHGNARVFGNVASADGAKFSGNVEIHYMPASAALTHQVWKSSKGVVLIGYNER